MQIFSFILLFLFQIQNLSAQEVQSAEIFVYDNTLIYSADNHFNQQIDDHKVLLKNTNLKLEKSKSNEVLVVKSQENQSIKNFADEVKFERKKQDEYNIKEIQKKVKLVEENISQYISSNLKGLPSDDLFSVNKNSDLTAASVTNQNHISKGVFEGNIDTFYNVFSTIHFQKYVFYNSKSLGFCFSKVFSVRPPPLFS